MSINYLDKTGLAYFWGKIKAAFVEKDVSKGLSTNDYTTAEKTKLAGIEAGANAYVLPTASANVKGGVKVGANLSINADGVLSASGGDDLFVTTGSANDFPTDGQTFVMDKSASDCIAAYNAGKSVVAILRFTVAGSIVFDAQMMLGTYQDNLQGSSNKINFVGMVPTQNSGLVDGYLSYAQGGSSATLRLRNYARLDSDSKIDSGNLPAATSTVLGGVRIGVANGVAPLNANGVIPEGYLPSQRETYVIHISVDQLFGNPTGDESELMGLREHDNAILDITAPTPVSGHYTAYLSKRTIAHYYFTLFIHDKTENRLKVYIYEVSPGSGRIKLDEKFTFVTEEE